MVAALIVGKGKDILWMIVEVATVTAQKNGFFL